MQSESGYVRHILLDLLLLVPLVLEKVHTETRDIFHFSNFVYKLDVIEYVLLETWKHLLVTDLSVFL